ncbi:MAG TPA: hypothetical protein VJ725_21350 [Thermoanaerobaculia bacterium]|nr:hypothetical protein [Thermoanaerobaculia bacterium]
MFRKQLSNQVMRYLDQLELPEVDTSLAATFRPEAAAFKDDTEGSAVNAGSLVSFVSGLTEIHKNDVLNSTLLAQLAASKQHDRFKDTMRWYNFYISVLAQVGWTMPAFAFRDYSPSGSSLVLSDAIIDILSAVATGNEMEILKASLGSLRDNPKNEGPLTLFDQQSFPENVGTFQIFPVAEDDGQLVMAMSAMQFNAEKHVTKFLWWSWTKTSVRLQQSAQKAVLNEDLYKRVRQQVIDKLGDRASQFIKDIEI